MKISRIDLNDYLKGDDQAKAAFVKTMGDSLLNTGFFILGGHGLDKELIHNVYEDFERFFALPEDVKKKYDTVKGGARGYTPFGREHAKDQSLPDLKEFWHVGQELAETHPYYHEYPANVWPEELPRLQKDAVALFKAFENCASTLLIALAQYFELPDGTFSEMMRDGNHVMRVIHYPPLSKEMPEGAVRAAAHEDINLITLLIESKGQGLEILTQEGDWQAVGALAGDIVVDSGDMLSRCTNGVIPATTHRVVNPPEGKNESRYSMPFFVHPYSRCDLDVMERFVTPDRQAQFPPITAGEFLEQRLREIGLID